MKAIIGHIILNVKEFNDSELFYDKILTEMGFEIDHVSEGDFGIMKSYKQGEHNLYIRFDRTEKSEKFVRNVGLDHLAFELNSETEVDKIYELINKLNVKITREPKKYPEYSESYYAFYFRDPNGIPLEVYLQ
ncbi:VOC family protein [Psychroserpens jangbogonensis]|uniref:VOC family protein n=1 Tax=Psychroserpens jangbogonensis TaxID=1484460 RepID=UPI00068BA479|nr:VOC family protein [Psychroserpens jangbogonensis]